MADIADSDTPTYCAGCGRRIRQTSMGKWFAFYADERESFFHHDYYDEPIKHFPGYGTASYWLNAGPIPANY